MPLSRAILLWLCACLSAETIRAASLVAEDAPWRWLPGTAEASAPDATAWRDPEWDDTVWTLAPGPFYYDLDPNPATAFTGRTLLADMPGHYSCVFLRHSFNIPSPSAWISLELRARSDDGFIAWLNGREIGRFNLPDGTIIFSGTATSPADEPLIERVVVVDNAATWLLPGANTLAIQAFNASLTDDPDFLISASLTGIAESVAPVIENLSPSADAIVPTLSALVVTFSEPVRGVDAADLLVNGHPAATVLEHSPREFEFGFAEPPPGVTRFAWAAGHDITDLSEPPNALADTTWTVTREEMLEPHTVVISEFLADNTAGLKDEDGSRGDWLELLNTGSEAVNLDGWFLTDSLTDLTRWRLPALSLPSGGYRLFWASGKDRRDPAGALHTNFKLSREGGFLALVDPRTNLVSAFSPYPVQESNISFGRDLASPETTGYYASPTPGTNNSVLGPGLSGEVTFSLPGGLYTNSTLTIALSVASGEIRYTLNGTVPTNGSPRYTAPLNLTAGFMIKARAFETGKLPGPVAVHAYSLLSASTRDFNSNLPLLVINTSGSSIPQETRVNAAVFAFEPRNGRTRLQAPPDFTGPAQIEVRGQSSTSFPKYAYNVELNDPYRFDVEVPLLGLPAESDWVLYNPYTEKCFMNNVLAFEMHEMMGHYASRRRFVEVFVDTTAGRLEYPRDYMGIFVLLEKIKIDPNRVDLPRLTPAITNEPAITGGYIIKKDKDSPTDRGFSSAGGVGFSGQYLKYHEPKPREITRAQETWIRSYINAFEQSLYATNWLTRTGTNHYSHYIDVDSLVDLHWIVEFPKQIDGYRLSNYISKDRGGKLVMGPIWDWNLAFGNADYLNGWTTSGWYYSQIDANAHIWLRRLINGTTSTARLSGDPDFNQRIVDRWSELRTNIFSTNRLVARIDELASYLNEAQARDFARWPRLNSYVWPNPSIYIAPTYRHIITNLQRWLVGRSAWIDTQMVRQPTLSHPGGPVTPGQLLSLTAPGSAIFYTLDGTDPRRSGGSTSPSARPYAGPITVTSNLTLVARAIRTNSWSGPISASYWTSLPSLRISEIMFHPAPSPALTNRASDFEFVELLNAGATPINLTGIRFTNAIRFNFSTSIVTRLEPGQRILVVRNLAAFRARYPTAGPIAGEYEGSLGNAGEQLTLVGRFQEPIAAIRFRDTWHPLADGAGFSLVPISESNPPLNTAEAWRPSANPDGSPGIADPDPLRIPHVIVAEALTHTDPPALDSVELLNLDSTTADLSGWFLSDDPLQPAKFRIPDRTTLTPGARIVFTETDFLGAQGGAFRLSSLGDEIHLFSATPSGILTGWRHGFAFGAAANGVSFGRILTTDEREVFWPLREPTLGQPNADPQTGPILINEILFNPAPVAGAVDTLNEFIELRNLATSPMPLFDPNHHTNTWRLRGGVEFDFPIGFHIEPQAHLLIVGFDPLNDPLALAGFRAKHNLSPDIPLLGPWKGHLDNAGDRITLDRPDIPQGPQAEEPGFVPRILVDQVRYSPLTPWPDTADGTGLSLQRRHADGLSDDPANWSSAWPTPANPNDGVAPDSDGDGMSDAWERAEGLNPDLATGADGAAGDPDQDGVNNLHEFLSGTRPHDASSALRIDAVRQADAGVLLRFLAAPGRAYRVEFREGWETGGWKSLAQIPIQTTGKFIEIPDPANSPRSRYYRVIIPTPGS